MDATWLIEDFTYDPYLNELYAPFLTRKDEMPEKLFIQGRTMTVQYNFCDWHEENKRAFYVPSYHDFADNIVLPRLYLPYTP